MIKRLLSYLLHHANRNSSSQHFYAIKKRILKKHGELVGYDVQYFEGKKCRSCGGSGYHPKYSWTTGRVYDHADCWHCYWGWYKLPTYVILERIQLGKYIFHQPLKAVYSEKKIDVPVFSKIEGYVSHNRSDVGNHCLMVLFLLYDFRRYMRQELKWIRRGYYSSWRSPYRFLNNIIHVFRYGYKSLPIEKFRRKFKKPSPAVVVQYSDDLPF